MAFVGFAVVTVYTMTAAFLLALKGIEGVEEKPVFLDIVLSLLATLGLSYHSHHQVNINTNAKPALVPLPVQALTLITSFVKYLFLTPSYINVLNVCTFSNVHNVSWGTKGERKPQTDLLKVELKLCTAKNEVEVAILTTKQDINALHEDAILSKPEKEKKGGLL
ncbi:hypothetical protein H0H92_002978 [Tricholoma furcatifolium]|nr:hypothetical protein H0H92_002978 [Tricholoma furcatifolium]